MKSIRQIIRQPLRSLSGMLLAALAVAVMCVSVSQTLAAANTAEELNETFMTVALPTSSAPLAEAQEVIDALVADNPDIFKADIYNGLASAWIPELELDNYTRHLYQSDFSTYNSAHDPYNVNYSNAIFEVKILEWTEPAESTASYGTMYLPFSFGYWGMKMEAEIVRVIGLEEGYDRPDEDSPIKRKLVIQVRLPDEESFRAFLEQLDLNTEDSYLVYGTGYKDLDWELRCDMADLMMWREEPELLDWDLSRIEGFEDPNAKGREISAANAEGREPDPTAYTRLKVMIGDLFHGLSWAEMDMFMHSRLSVGNSAALPKMLDMEFLTDESGMTTVKVTFDESESVSYTDGNGQAATLSKAEYIARYDTPMMAKLSGTAEEFLSGNPEWQALLDDIEINSHAFPIIGVEGLEYVGQFATGKAEISDGRSFSNEEIAAGAKVCVMAKSLAEANGLSVGDSIDLGFYSYDSLYPEQSEIGNSEGVLNVSAHFYNAGTTPMKEMESYTIVGLYEQDAPWGKIDDDFYAFTPNTIFVPAQSVPVQMEYSSHGMFRTLVVNSDMLYEMQLLTVDMELDGMFYYYDNGYAAVAEQLDSFREAAEQFLPMGLVIYGILMLLFLFLFPGRMGRELAMMDSMGSGLWARVRHMLLSCMGLLIPGTVIGTGIGLLLWRKVSDFLIQWSEADISVELDAAGLWAAAAVQVVFVALLTLIIAVSMAKRANLMKRK